MFRHVELTRCSVNNLARGLLCEKLFTVYTGKSCLNLRVLGWLICAVFAVYHAMFYQFRRLKCHAVLHNSF